MESFIQAVVRHKRIVFITFIFLVLSSGMLSSLVKVNYNMIDYLPEDAQSTTAIEIMDKEFAEDMPNARVMVKNVSVQEALEYKAKFEAVDGIVSASWLDDIIGLDTLKTTPLEFADQAVVENYYKDQTALISLTIASGKEKTAMDKVYQLIGEDNAAAGEAVNAAEAQSMSVSEVGKAMAILLPIIIIILIMSTSSWLEPVLFLGSIGVAIVINMGTNIMFSEVSFITQTVSPILQLAVSLDYSIFLLHSFGEFRMDYNPERAMVLAVKKALPTIAASAATTVIGFAALIFMRFGIGADLGVNLLKGIIFSFISVIVFLPVVTLMCYKGIDKTMHKKIMPNFKTLGHILLKIKVPLMILAFIIVLPSFLAQANTMFTYGTGSATENTKAGKDTLAINKQFGKENILVLLVPTTTKGVEKEICDSLSKIPHITSVVSFVTAVGPQIPADFVPKKALDQFYSPNYTRIILYTDTQEEGKEAFETVQTVMDHTKKFSKEHYIAGQSAALYDMKNVISKDTRTINFVAIVGIFIVLLLTFRSFSLPVFLLFSIETAIWINLSFPYFSGQPLSFIGYLIISTVQLGATVDYAILLTNAYLENRKILPKKEAMTMTMEDNLVAILISAGILSFAGFTLAFTTTNPTIGELGTLLGRGTLLSLTMVAGVLPALLLVFDSLIQKTHFKKLSER